MTAPSSIATGTSFAVARRRRAFGLDTVRPPDLGRRETAVRDWLTTRMPRVVVLRAEEAAASRLQARTLVLLLPAGRTAVLRVETKPERPCARTLMLAEQCENRRVPFAVVADADEARAALRRFGLEPDEAPEW